MNKPIFELKNVTVLGNKNSSNVTKILNNLSLTINDGDFITVIGTNGAGKSTLLNVISGALAIDDGIILHNGRDITNLSEEEHTKFLSRVFQDPQLGTAPRMTVAENMLLALKRGERRFLVPRKLKQNRERFLKLAKMMHNGLEECMDTFTGNLSGGQRQALSFLMAILKKPDILLLDEHTAALDPHTSQSLLNATREIISQDKITALMITHHLEDALNYGNRLLVLKQGKIIADLDHNAKIKLTTDDLYRYFELIIINKSQSFSKITKLGLFNVKIIR